MLDSLLTSAMVDSGSENSVTKKTYISCIKIAGVPILPPLITPEKRLEIEKYRQEAIQIEKRLKTRPSNKTLENSLAFDPLALEECDEDKSEDNLVPSKKLSQLSSNIFDVTEYGNNGVILFTEAENHTEVSKQIHETELLSPQPRLLRSNSYTLDAPSPILVEHFKKHLKEPSATNISINRTEASLITLSSNSSSETIKKNAICTTDSFSQFIRDFQLEEANSVSKVDAATDYSIDCIEFLSPRVMNFASTSQNKLVNDIQKETPSTEIKCCDTSTDPMNSSSMLLIDFESDTGDNLTFCCEESSKASILDFDFCCSPLSIDKPKGSCSRQLFAARSKLELKSWAATVLTAAVRGYLVRRLKCTERVTNLIQTIRDALICAMSLHSETTDSIQPQDVELHRRLIQQISSACYEFYDIFFNLSIKEKMEIIALDRQKLKEKLKRPSSAVSVGSSGKMGGASKGSFNTKQKKALVTSLVS
ncbi:hypothetical protein FQR65_LT11608 [Abscondita terminalis]|nr:hypothetical protein FQR65_LT11608 [Abscondita terminalis]